MAQKFKDIKERIESLEKQIEIHFEKLEKEIKGGDFNSGRYHVKEIELSFLKNIEKRISIMQKHGKEIDSELVKRIESYKKRLEDLKEKVGQD
jgi:hypothetical protein